MKVFYLFIFLKIPSGLLEGEKNSSRLFFHHQLYGMTRQRGAPWRSRPEKQTPEDVEEDEDDENELQIESEATEESSLFTRSGGVSRLGEDERHEVRPWGAKTRVSGLVYQGSKKWLHVLGLPLFKVLFFRCFDSQIRLALNQTVPSATSKRLRKSCESTPIFLRFLGEEMTL